MHIEKRYAKVLTHAFRLTSKVAKTTSFGWLMERFMGWQSISFYHSQEKYLGIGAIWRMNALVLPT